MEDEQKRQAVVVGCGRRSALYWAGEIVRVARVHPRSGWQFTRVRAAAVEPGDWLAISASEIARVRRVSAFCVCSSFNRTGARIARVTVV